MCCCCCSAYVPEPRGVLHEVSALVKEVSTIALRLQLSVLAGGGFFCKVTGILCNNTRSVVPHIHHGYGRECTAASR